MNGQLLIAALAIVASTATAVISVIVSSKSQRSAIREQHLWETRTDAYLALQTWSYEMTDWSDQKLRLPPPALDQEAESRITLFSSPFVLHHFSGMKTVILELEHAARADEWDRYHDLQCQLGIGWAIDLSSAMQDELRGSPNEFVALSGNRIRYKRRYLWTIRWHVFMQRFRHKKVNDAVHTESDADDEQAV